MTNHSPAQTYFEKSHLLLHAVEAQLPEIQKAADWFAQSILAGRMVHVFGSGHSRIMVEEMWPRYGSFPGFNPIVELSLSFHNLVVGANGQRQAMFLENVTGLAERILRNFAIGPADSALVISSSGCNLVPIEMAEGFQKHGIKVVVIVSRKHSEATTSKHPAGKKLQDFADLVLDTGAPVGDAMVKLPGLDTPVSPGSTVGGCLLVNAIKAEVAARLIAAGQPPKVLTAAAVVGAERATQLFEAPMMNMPIASRDFMPTAGTNPCYERSIRSAPPSSAATRFRDGWSLPASISTDFGEADRAELQDDAVIAAIHDQMAAGLDVITDGEQTRLDFNLSFYGYIEGIELESAPPRRFGPPAHDQRGKHKVTGELRAPRGLGAVEEFKRLRRLFEAVPANLLKPVTLKASVPGPYTLSGRLLPNKQYPDRWALTEALLPIVRKELEDLVAAGCREISVDEPSMSCYAHREDPRRFVDIFNRTVEGIAGKGRICTHLCFGNYKARAVGPRRLAPMFPAFLDFHCDEMHLEMASREFAEIGADRLRRQTHGCGGGNRRREKLLHRNACRCRGPRSALS